MQVCLLELYLTTHNKTHLALVSAGLSMNFPLQNEKRGHPKRVRASVMPSETSPPPSLLPQLHCLTPVCSPFLWCGGVPILQVSVRAKAEDCMRMWTQVLTGPTLEAFPSS